MTLTRLDLETLVRIVQHHCDNQARRFKAQGEVAFGPVFEKLVDNLSVLSGLDKPLEHYAHATAYREARRFFRRERDGRLIQAREEF